LVEAQTQQLRIRLAGEAENGDELVPADDDEPREYRWLAW